MTVIKHKFSETPLNTVDRVKAMALVTRMQMYSTKQWEGRLMFSVTEQKKLLHSNTKKNGKDSKKGFYCSKIKYL